MQNQHDTATDVLLKAVDDAFTKGYHWATGHNSIRDLELLRSYFLLRAGELTSQNIYDSDFMARRCQSILTIIDPKLLCFERRSPRDSASFIKGAIEALKHRKMLERRRIENGRDLYRTMKARPRSESRPENMCRPTHSQSA
jgi:hypothetical protein